MPDNELGALGENVIRFLDLDRPTLARIARDIGPTHADLKVKAAAAAPDFIGHFDLLRRLPETGRGRPQARRNPPDDLRGPGQARRRGLTLLPATVWSEGPLARSAPSGISVPNELAAHTPQADLRVHSPRDPPRLLGQLPPGFVSWYIVEHEPHLSSPDDVTVATELHWQNAVDFVVIVSGSAVLLLGCRLRAFAVSTPPAGRAPGRLNRRAALRRQPPWPGTGRSDESSWGSKLEDVPSRTVW